MKRILLCILFLFALGFSALAHSGDTDEKGGHHVGGTSEYHYHHGYPAHQHEDGVCPYEFDDRTGYNSGSSVDSPDIPAMPEPPKDLEVPWFGICTLLVAVVIFVLLVRHFAKTLSRNSPPPGSAVAAPSKPKPRDYDAERIESLIYCPPEPPALPPVHPCDKSRSVANDSPFQDTIS